MKASARFTLEFRDGVTGEARSITLPILFCRDPDVLLSLSPAEQERVEQAFLNFIGQVRVMLGPWPEDWPACKSVVGYGLPEQRQCGKPLPCPEHGE